MNRCVPAEGKAAEDCRTPRRSRANERGFQLRDSVLECGSPLPLWNDRGLRSGTHARPADHESYP